MRMPVLLVLLLLAAVPEGARAAELKLATWNLDWLTERVAGDRALPGNVRPKGAESFALLRRYAAILAADVVALQEVDGAAVVARLFPAESYRIHITQDSVIQRVAIAIRTGIQFTANPDVTAFDQAPEGRRRLRSGADVTLDLPGGRLRLLAVHLKAGCRQERLTNAAREACGTLKYQLGAMQGWIRERQREGMPFVVLGDFNRWMDNGDAFWAGLNQAAPLLRATEGTHSPCWGGSAFIDHIIAGGAARGWMAKESLSVMVYRETGEEWKERLSDHCAVSVRLRLPG